MVENCLHLWKVRARKSPWIETHELLHVGMDPTVRARKSPWIETGFGHREISRTTVRARKSPWIETEPYEYSRDVDKSGLVRARGLKQNILDH